MCKLCDMADAIASAELDPATKTNLLGRLQEVTKNNGKLAEFVAENSPNEFAAEYMELAAKLFDVKPEPKAKAAGAVSDLLQNMLFEMVFGGAKTAKVPDPKGPAVQIIEFDLNERQPGETVTDFVVRKLRERHASSDQSRG